VLTGVLLAVDATTTTTTTYGAHTSTTTTSTTPRPQNSCDAVKQCVDDPQCAGCIAAVNASAGFPHSLAEYFSPGALAGRAYQAPFFAHLVSTASCATNATLPGIIHPALQELATPRCSDAYGMAVGNCLVAEYACFADPDCQTCLTALYAAPGNGTSTKTDVFRSAACTTTIPQLLQDLTSACTSFPRCTFAKTQCSEFPTCVHCTNTLSDGGGAEAARQCHGPSVAMVATAMDNFVNACFDSNSIACEFYIQRCADNVNCSACLGAVSNGESAQAIAAEWSAPSCQRAIHDPIAMSYLQYLAVCPDIGSCRVTISNCVGSYGNLCVSCIDGSAPASDAATCLLLLQQYDVGGACQPCPSSVSDINAIVLATAVIGGVSAAACIAVAATIVAQGRDFVSMRARIVIGLMLSNAVYSTANAIPLNALRTGFVSCGRLSMSFDAIRFGRAWWFCGKYSLVSFELLIVGASIRALSRGLVAVRPRTEAALHASCCAVGVLAFGVFYLLCARINAVGYNINTETEALSDAFQYGSETDDLDDDAPYRRAGQRFQTGRDEYDHLVREMLVAWDVLVGVAVVLWFVLRLMHTHALHALRAEAAAMARAELADVWADTRRSGWAARRQVLEARENAFAEVARPLEPYIAVFFAFTIPAFVMSTSFCEDHSGASKGADVASEKGWWSGTFAGANNFTCGLPRPPSPLYTRTRTALSSPVCREQNRFSSCCMCARNCCSSTEVHQVKSSHGTIAN
jgi:hypothetical protein